MDDERQIALAKQAYYAYGSVTDFKNFQSNPMPEWEQLPGIAGMKVMVLLLSRSPISRPGGL